MFSASLARSRALIRYNAMMSSTCTIAVLQITSTSDKLRNRDKCLELLTKAKKFGAEAAFLPEAFDYVGESSQQTHELAEYLDEKNGTISFYQGIASQLKMALSLGGFHERMPHEERKLSNSHVFIGSDGALKAVYRKAHLFDVEIPERGVLLKESDYVRAGGSIGRPVQLLVDNVNFHLGLSICYDLRFPELALALRRRGANILTYPSAFTVPTGAAGHWYALLKARAIENQCYVIAAAQTGKHNEKRSSYGHACVIDPWGTIVAECCEGESMAIAELNVSRISTIRRDMPIEKHRRHDLYGLIAKGEAIVGDDALDSSTLKFGPHDVPGRSVIFTSRMSYVLVNRKPVKDGHLLAVPKRGALRVVDLTADEVQDLFMTVQVAQKLVESFYSVEASTISIQDGKDAGQTVPHVHVHILPRKAGDFKKNDEIYEALESHDKGDDIKWRDYEEMFREAATLRQHFRDIQL